MIFHDENIQYPWQDTLDRQEFAEKLADGIFNIPCTEGSYVIGITGEWGDGKTSVINLIEYYLMRRQIQNASRSVQFFGDIGAELSSEELDKAAENLFYRNLDSFTPIRQKIKPFKYECPNFIRRACQTEEHAYSLYRYTRLKEYIEEKPEIIVIPFSPWMISGQKEITLALLTEIGRSIQGKLEAQTQKAFLSYIHELLKFLPVAGAVLDFAAGTTAGNILNRLSGWGQDAIQKTMQGETLDCLRSNLINYLRKLSSQKLLIILDDLDRLTPEEALRITSLVKSVVDLPNIIFLLSYDEKKLCELIKTSLKVDGKTYLDKIVQYKKQLPIYEARDIEKDLKVLLSEPLKIASSEESARYEAIKVNILRNYLKSPRAIKTLQRQFFFDYSALSQHIDKLDLLILTVLHIFDPNIYNIIRDQGADFKLLYKNDFQESEENEKFLKAIDRQSAHSEVAKIALEFLFPRLRPILSTNVSSGPQTHSPLCIRNEHSFFNYFRLDIRPSSFSGDRLKYILSFENASEALTEFWKITDGSSTEDEKVVSLQTLMKTLVTESAAGNINQTWMIALSDNYKQLLSIANQGFSLNQEIIEYLDRIAREYFQRLEQLERAGHLISIIQKTSDISLWCRFFRRLAGDKNSSGIKADDTFFGSGTEEIRECLLSYINLLVKKKTFWLQASPQDTIWFWSGVAPDDLRNFTNSETEHLEGLRNLWQIKTGWRTDSEGITTYIVPQTMEKLVDLQKFEATTRKLLEEKKLRKEDQKLAQDFLMALEVGRSDPF